MKKIALSLLVLGLFTACQPQTREATPTIACDSDVVKTTFDLGTKQQIMAKLKYLAQAQPEVYGSLNFSQIEQDLKQIQFNLDGINTASAATDSPQICQADVQVLIPNDLIISAQLKANELNQTFNLAAEAFQAQLGQSPNGFYQVPVQYQASGAADTKSPMVQSNADTKLTQFLLRLLTIGQLKTNTPASVSDVLEAPIDLTPAKPAAASEAKDAIGDLIDQVQQNQNTQTNTNPNDLTHNQAQRNRSEAQVEQIWSELPSDVQQTLENEQNQWRNKRQQTCQQAAANASSDAERKNVLAHCEVQSNQKRLEELKQYHVPN